MMRWFFVLLAILFFVPIVTVFVFSFLDDNLTVTLRNYDELLFNCFIFYRMFWNSVSYGVIIAFVQIFIIIPCAFGFIFAKFPGKRVLFFFYIALMMMPLQVTILPNFIGLREIGLINTRWAVILPAVFSPFGVVVLRQYLLGSDYQLVEAIRLDTNSLFKTLWYAVIPQIKICIIAVVFFIFADCWNKLEQFILFINDEGLRTLTVFLSNRHGTYDIAVMMPAAVIYIIPMLLLYGLFNENLQKGLKLGEFK
jgi:multiple sugar transport system permease protein